MELWTKDDFDRFPLLKRNLQICEMRKSGMTLQRIADAIGITDNSVRVAILRTSRKTEERLKFLKNKSEAGIK